VLDFVPEFPGGRVNSPAASNNRVADASVLLAPLLTPAMLDVTSCVPAAACCTLRAISWVAAVEEQGSATVDLARGS